jgi:hypothetical protein
MFRKKGEEVASVEEKSCDLGPLVLVVGRSYVARYVDNRSKTALLWSREHRNARRNSGSNQWANAGDELSPAPVTFPRKCLLRARGREKSFISLHCNTRMRV